jgi:hypothetical protein
LANILAMRTLGQDTSKAPPGNFDVAVQLNKQAQSSIRDLHSQP